MMLWIQIGAGADLGFLPSFLDDKDPRPAAEQIDANYAHGGGWRPQPGFKVLSNFALQYPGDPPMSPRAMTMLRDETICFYPYAYLAIFQPDNSFEVCRVD